MENDFAMEMTDVQKLYVAMASANTAINDLQHTVDHDHKMLFEGNGEVPLVQRVRELELYIASLKFWARAVALAILAQTVAFLGVSIYVLIQVFPILQKVATGEIVIVPK